MVNAAISAERKMDMADDLLRGAIDKLILNHPDSKSIGASVEQVVEMASLGVYVEICALGLMLMRLGITPAYSQR